MELQGAGDGTMQAKLPRLKQNIGYSNIIDASKNKNSELVKLPAIVKLKNIVNYQVAPMAAGISSFELMRKLEIEKIISRNDRLVLLEMMKKDSTMKEVILKQLQNLELKTSKASIRKLKDCVIAYINAGQAQLSTTVDKDEMEPCILDTKSAISRAVGQSPVYSGPENFDICSKIQDRLKDYIALYGEEKAKMSKFAVIVGSGSFNPLTRMHIRACFIAKQYIESHSNIYVLGSILSPAHPSLVRQRFRTCVSEIIPAPHRLAIAQLSVQDSIWLAIDPWEITRRRNMDYLSLLEHSSKVLNTVFPQYDITPIYLCKVDTVPLLSPNALRAGKFGCVCVCRPPYSDNLISSLGQEWKDLMWVAEDTAIVDASFDTVSSRKVRSKVRGGEPFEHLVGKVVADYFKLHRIGDKMNRKEKWNKDEISLPKLVSAVAAAISLSAAPTEMKSSAIS